MARPVSSLESHPQRSKIIEALIAGSTLRQIAAWAQPPVTTAAICRWRQRSTATLQAATEAVKAAVANKGKDLVDGDGQVQRDVTQAVTRAALVAAADPFVSRIVRHQATLDAEIAGATGDARGVAALINTDLKGLELHARLTGRLDTQPNQTNILIVCPAGQAEPAVTLEPDAVVIDIGPRR